MPITLQVINGGDTLNEARIKINNNFGLVANDINDILNGAVPDIDDVANVVITNVQSGQILQYDGSNWVNVSNSSNANDYAVLTIMGVL